MADGVTMAVCVDCFVSKSGELHVNGQFRCLLLVIWE